MRYAGDPRLFAVVSAPGQKSPPATNTKETKYKGLKITAYMLPLGQVMNNTIQEGHKPAAACEVPGQKQSTAPVAASRHHQGWKQTT